MCLEFIQESFRKNLLKDRQQLVGRLLRCCRFGGIRVSDFLYKPSFLFYVKKRVTFGQFLKSNFLELITQNLRPK